MSQNTIFLIEYNTQLHLSRIDLYTCHASSTYKQQPATCIIHILNTKIMIQQ